MDTKNCFYSSMYKGQYIHGCYNVTKKGEEITFNNNVYYSLHAVKIAITKFNKDDK
jgi:hypothetical protein